VGAIQVGENGDIRQDGALVSNIGVFRPPDSATLGKRPGTFFRFNGDVAELGRADAGVVQGHLEAANAQAPELAVRLIAVMRQFEMLQKAIQIGGEMGRASADLAKPGS
jgi:flagellar basal body rod protein FlgG